MAAAGIKPESQVSKMKNCSTKKDFLWVRKSLGFLEKKNAMLFVGNWVLYTPKLYNI